MSNQETNSREKERAYAQSYRETRKAMGFKHVTTYIPANREKEFTVIVERMKAERAMEIVDLSPPNSPEARALASRYFAPMPSIKEINGAKEMFEDNPTGRELCKQCTYHIEQHNLSINAVRLVENLTEDQETTMLGKAVAHNFMANAMWLEISWLMEETYRESLPV